MIPKDLPTTGGRWHLRTSAARMNGSQAGDVAQVHGGLGRLAMGAFRGSAVVGYGGMVGKDEGTTLW